MALPFYLAMTAAEMQNCSALPSRIAYMACHFSPYSTGLSNCPKELPEGSLLILNDRTPIRGHNRERIGQQLMEMAKNWSLRGILLDFQQPGCEETAELAAHIAKALPCPVIVSEAYAANLDCPIFLPPVPPDVLVAEYVKPWQGRETWLEAAMDGLEITLTESGAVRTTLPYPEFTGKEFKDETLHCHNNVKLVKDSALFTLRRTREDVEALFSESEELGITAAVGLWQEFN